MNIKNIISGHGPLSTNKDKAVPKRSDGDFIVTMNLKTRYLNKNEKNKSKSNE